MRNPGKFGNRKVKVIIIGHDGYIGSVMTPILQVAGHEIAGVDIYFFSDRHNKPGQQDFPVIEKDIRDFDSDILRGYEAIIHLAALSNDPLSEMNPALTSEINYWATINIARLAKEAGVRRFLFASTCSVYGMINENEQASEKTAVRPLTEYAVSKVRVEKDLAGMADASFSPVILRNATAYGWSPNFRSDLVLNNLAGWAFTSKEIRIMSDGTPWRPIIHVSDIAKAFEAILTAPQEIVHNQVFNVGVNYQNYQVRELAEIVREGFLGCRVIYDEHGGPDPRSYRVDFSKINKCIPEFKPSWNAQMGVEELRNAYQEINLSYEDFSGPKYVRIAKLKSLIQEGRLERDLRWKV